MLSIRVTIIEQLTSTTYIIRCAYCQGKGKDPSAGFRPSQKQLSAGSLPFIIDSWKSSPCEVCNGKGVVRVECDDIPVACQFCEATGATIRESGGGGQTAKDVNSIVDWTTACRVAGVCSQCQGVGAQSLSGVLQVLH